MPVELIILLSAVVLLMLVLIFMIVRHHHLGKIVMDSEALVIQEGEVYEISFRQGLFNKVYKYEAPSNLDNKVCYAVITNYYNGTMGVDIRVLNSSSGFMFFFASLKNVIYIDRVGTTTKETSN